MFTPGDYLTAVGARLKATLGASTPIYHLYNTTKNLEAFFIVISARAVGTTAFTGPEKTVQGIDNPTIQISLFGATYSQCDNTYRQIMDDLHGYYGYINPNSTGPSAKCSLEQLFTTYEDETSRFHLVSELTLFVSN